MLIGLEIRTWTSWCVRAWERVCVRACLPACLHACVILPTTQGKVWTHSKINLWSSFATSIPIGQACGFSYSKHFVERSSVPPGWQDTPCRTGAKWASAVGRLKASSFPLLVETSHRSKETTWVVTLLLTVKLNKTETTTETFHSGNTSSRI